jgi:acetyl esterase/lipase
MCDARAAVRWLRRNATSYRIDENKIAIGGGSAGAFTALHVAYASGEGDSGNPGYSSRVAAVIDLWGGLLDITDMTHGEPPLMVIHGTADRTVAFSFADSLVRRAKDVGVVCEFHPLEGQGHAAWAQMVQFIDWIAPFLYRHMDLEGFSLERFLPPERRIPNPKKIVSQYHQNVVLYKRLQDAGGGLGITHNLRIE